MTQDLASQMRLAMRCLTAGVCVITSTTQDGQRVAMTASSVTSVSDAPPSVLVCVNQEARIDDAISQSKRFAVNVLAADHEKISNLCASPVVPEQRFSAGHWLQQKESGLWYLEAAPAVIFCELANKVTHGTHNIFIGNIVGTQLNSARENASMLAYLNGLYRYLPFDGK